MAVNEGEDAPAEGRRPASLESRLAPTSEAPERWQRKRQPEVCEHCHERPPVWLVLDPKTHFYIRIDWGSEEPKVSKEQPGYLLCDRCKKNAARFARHAKVARILRFVRWA